MTPEDLIAAFDTLADAPDGVKRLRELVLSLAVRGKLVAQDPAEGTASDAIEAVRRARTKDGGRTSKAGPVRDHEAAWQIPETWSWARFGDLFDCRLGKMLDKAKNKGPLRPYLRNANVRWGKFELGDVLQMRLEDHELPDVTVRRADLVICEGGEPGRCAVWTHDEEVVIQKALHRARPFAVASDFFQLHLRSDYDSGRLFSRFTGATIKHLTGKALDVLPVVLPPLPEQRRIVARVDELMGLLDRLEAARGIRESVRREARDAALAELRDAPDADAAGAAWSRVDRHMDDLFAAPEDVAPLRQAVLQLAVRGRLVAQDPGEEPAHELLARSRAERVSAGKKSSTVGPSDLEALPSVPSSWTWTHMDDLLLDIQAGWSPSAQKRPKEGSEWGVLKVSACSWGRFLPEENKALDPEMAPRLELEVRTGDLLISRANTVDLVARSVFVEKAPPRLMLSDKTLRLFPTTAVDARYLNLANLSDVARTHYAANATGTSASMRNVSQAAIRRTPIPVPPLPEQRRIVAKVDSLMATCDAFEARLTTARDLHGQFAAAAIHHLEA